MLNALAPGTNLQSLYKWLATAAPNGDGPVVASFNHPGPHQYDDWAYRDPRVTDVITMMDAIRLALSDREFWPNIVSTGWKRSRLS